MCTAVRFRDRYFGRTLDLDRSYCETVTITPRNYPLQFLHCPDLRQHHAIIGMAYVLDGYPLYYDGVNEAGLAMAGLNFPGNAHYGTPVQEKDNVASFELLPWLLGQCTTVQQASVLLQRLQITQDAFREDLPPTPLHWLLADKTEALVIEATADGLHIYSNPVGVLTNNPRFPSMMDHLRLYRGISAQPSENRFAPGLALRSLSSGMGAMGLPGDLSSPSRFVRAAFTKENAVILDGENDGVSQFFHILETVSQTRGCVRMEQGGLEITVYTSCCDMQRGIYCYTTYGNRRITAVDLHREDLDGAALRSYPLLKKQDILIQNREAGLQSEP